MKRLRALLIVLTATLFLSGSSAVAEERKVELTLLSKAKQLESSHLGDCAARSENFAAYKKLADNVQSLTMDDLMWLKANGTPASRVYAAFLAYKKDPAAGQHSFLEFLDDDTPLSYQTGCEVMQDKVSDIGKAIVATGKYLDFEGTTSGGTPIYVNVLSKAKVFADSFGGEGGRNLEWLVYDAARQWATALDPKDLATMLTKATPAGKLYAAVLQDSSGKTAKHAGFNALLADKSQLQYLSGCKASHLTLGEAAKKLKETGRLYNFQLQ
jgi:hypothetical protein